MRCVIVLLALTIMVTPAVVTGASFNCSNAATSVEKTICASKVLSNLDEQIAEAHSSAIHVSDNPDSLKRQQQAWLRNIRNQRQDESCLKGVYENRLAQLGEANQLKWMRFRDAHIGIEFSYPSNRKVEVGCRGSSNCIALIGKPMPNSDYLMALEVFDGDLETVAEDKAVFEKKNDGWIAKGRFGEYPVVPLVGPGWRGFKSIVDCGITDRNGFHAGAGECMWGVLSDGRRSVVVDTQGIVGIDEASMRLIQSIRFSE